MADRPLTDQGLSFRGEPPTDERTLVVDAKYPRKGLRNVGLGAPVVAKLEVSEGNQNATSDPNGGSPYLVCVAYDAAGKRVEGAIVAYHVEPGGTGSGFYPEGGDGPIMDSFAETYPDGTSIPIDDWKTGPEAGKAVIHATAVGGEPTATIDFSRTVSDRLPAKLTIVSGGEVIRCVPGDEVVRDITVMLVDGNGVAITWGRVDSVLVDDDESGCGLLTRTPAFNDEGTLVITAVIAAPGWKEGAMGGLPRTFHLEIYRPNYQATTQRIPCILEFTGT